MEEKEIQDFPSRRGQVVLIVLLVLMLGVPIGKRISKLVQEQLQTQALKEQPGYFVCSDSTEYYYMLNTNESDDALPLVQEIFDSGFIAELKGNSKFRQDMPDSQPFICVNIVLPNEGISYGFQKAWEDIFGGEWAIPDYERRLLDATQYHIYIQKSDNCLEDCEIVKVNLEIGAWEWEVIQSGN